MSQLRNNVQLIGHLGADPEIKTLDNGRKRAGFRMATNESYQVNGEWKTETQWHQVIAWGALAERVEQGLKKGSFVLLQGKLEHRSYEDSSGQTRYTTEVRVRSFLSLDKNERGEEDQADQEVL